MNPPRPMVSVHLLPSLIPPGALKGGVAVVVDVLRATTVMVHALASGCEAVIPCLEIEDARRAAASLPPGTALLGGERGGLPIEGFDLGNSPGDYTPEACRGKTLVMTTTNGTKAILASLEAERVLIGAFVNLKAVATELSAEIRKAYPRPIHIVCAGTEGAISLEDSLLAGAIAHEVTGSSPVSLEPGPREFNDEGHLALAFWLEMSRFRSKIPLGQTLGRVLASGEGGRNVRRIGLGRDIEEAARTDRFDLVPRLRRDPLRITRA